MKPETFIFLGPSGCGKGTQVALLKTYLETHMPSTAIISIDVGSLFRDFWQKGGYTEKLSQAINARGGLQPAFLQVYQWANVLVGALEGREHIIIDGTPRRLVDAHIMDSVFPFFMREKPYFIFLNISRDTARKRIIERARTAGGRPEDRDQALIESRLDWYDTYVVPAIDFFRDNARYHFIEINGDQPIEKVHEDIIAAIST